MHSLTNLDTMLTSSNINKNDIVIFSYGEIDCRFRIGKILYNNNYNAEKIVDELVSSYISKIQTISKTYSCIPIVYLPVPPYPLYNRIDNPEFPTIGPIKQRVDTHKYMCKKLTEICNSNNIRTLDILKTICLPTGEMNSLYCDRFNIHIRDEFYPIIQNELVRILTDLSIIKTNYFSNCVNYIFENVIFN